MQYKKSFALVTLFVFALSGFATLPAHIVYAQTITPCEFAVDLEIGSEGEAVRCLQKFLNNNGFKVADVGVGSPGNETNLFGGLTREAVKKWQTSNGVTPTGTFGPLSKAEYLKKVASLLTSQISALTPGSLVSTPGPLPIATVIKPVEGAEQKKARTLIREARDAIKDAEDDVEDADEENIDIEEIEDEIDDAKNDLLDAYSFFIDENYARAIAKAEDIVDAMDEIFEDVNGNEGDAEEAIQDAEDTINEAEDEINEADDDGERVRESRDLLEEAEDLLEEAQDAFDDRDYEEAEELANEAEELAEDAVDAIGE